MQVKDDFKQLKMSFDIEEIRSHSKFIYNKMIKSCVEKLAYDYLINEKNKQQQDQSNQGLTHNNFRRTGSVSGGPVLLSRVLCRV